MSMFEAYLKETNKIKEEYAQSALRVKTFVILMGGERCNFFSLSNEGQTFLTPSRHTSFFFNNILQRDWKCLVS